MEIGHNVMHGQWDWMNDPEIHSSNWEWDTAQPAEQWKHSHNYIHHQFTNVLGHDNDIGYGVLRMAREQKWHPVYLGQPVFNALLAGLFQWGVALHDLDLEAIRKGKKDPVEMKRQLRQIARKGRNQVIKDYVVYPALSGRQWKSTLKANATANLARNLWSYMIIFCGHFPDGALHFTEEELEDETRAEWYLRQMLGSANFEGGKLLHIMSGSLGFQIEHHLFPDLPSNRYPEIAEQGARALRQVRHPLHDRPAAPAVRPGAAHDHEAVAAQLDDVLRQARAAVAVDRPRPAHGRRAAHASYRDGWLLPEQDRMSTRTMDRAWVTQCALSRICGVCERPLGRPIAFVGTAEEVGRNAFHLPPMHVECAGSWSGDDYAAGHDGGLRVRPAGQGGRRQAADVPAQLAAVAVAASRQL